MIRAELREIVAPFHGLPLSYGLPRAALVPRSTLGWLVSGPLALNAGGPSGQLHFRDRHTR